MSGSRKLRAAVGRLMLALWIGTACLVALSPGASAQPPFGSSFDCARDTSSLTAIVCDNDQLRHADLEQLQKYYVLRHAAPGLQQDARNRFNTALRRLRSECELSAYDQISACVMRHLTVLRETWLASIRETQNSSALEEARLSPEQLLRLQGTLRAAGYLPANSAIDGIFGTGTRQAITRLQSERGLSATGFMTLATEQTLLDGGRRQASVQQPIAPATQAVRNPQPIRNASPTLSDYESVMSAVGLTILAIVLTYVGNIYSFKGSMRLSRYYRANVVGIIDASSGIKNASAGWQDQKISAEQRRVRDECYRNIIYKIPRFVGINIIMFMAFYGMIVLFMAGANRVGGNSQMSQGAGLPLEILFPLILVGAYIILSPINFVKQMKSWKFHQLKCTSCGAIFGLEMIDRDEKFLYATRHVSEHGYVTMKEAWKVKEKYCCVACSDEFSGSYIRR